LKQDAEKSRKEQTRFRMMHDKEISFLGDQLSALRAALKLSEKECDDVKRELEKEVRNVLKLH
jgi:hypothetical protein